VGGPEPVLSRKTTNYPYYYIRFEGEYEWKKRFLKINGSVLEIYKDISVASH
jgi:ribosome biogenesis protein Tsr3